MRISDWSSDVCSSDLFPQTIGFVRNTLAARRCDLIIGVATTNELMQNTNPYYRSGYVIVHRPELQLTEGRLDDPVFKALRVGMQPRTPVATLVARYGLLARARSYPPIFPPPLAKPARHNNGRSTARAR